MSIYMPAANVAWKAHDANPGLQAVCVTKGCTNFATYEPLGLFGRWYQTSHGASMIDTRCGDCEGKGLPVKDSNEVPQKSVPTDDLVSAAKVAWHYKDTLPLAKPFCVTDFCVSEATYVSLDRDGTPYNFECVGHLSSCEFNRDYIYTRCWKHSDGHHPIKFLPLDQKSDGGGDQETKSSSSSKRPREGEDEEDLTVLETPPRPTKKASIKAPDAPSRRESLKKEHVANRLAKEKEREEAHLNEEINKAKTLVSKVFQLKTKSLTGKQEEQIKSKFGSLLRMSEDGYVQENWEAPSYQLYMMTLFHVLGDGSPQMRDGLLEYGYSDEEEEEEEENEEEEEE